MLKRKKVRSGTGSSSGSRRTSADAWKVRGLTDQDGNKWLQVVRSARSAVGSLHAYMTSPASFWQQLAEQDVVITAPASKQHLAIAIEAIEAWPENIYVATRPGHHCGAFVMPDGQLIGKPAATYFKVVLGRRTVPLGRAGSLQAWQDAVRQHVQDQPIATLAVCLALTGPIIELSPYPQNVAVELVGKSSIGKTTMLDLCASIWGAPSQLPGTIGLSLRSTLNGLEEHMLARAGAVFPGDEVNLLGFDASKQGTILADVAFMLSHGIEKSRFENPAEPGAHFASLLTSNRPFSEMLRGIPSDNAEAALVRLMTMPADAGRGRGVMKRVPSGFSSSGAAIEALNAALVENHGHAAAAYVERLVRERRRDEVALRSTIARRAEEFLQRSLVDRDCGLTLRRAEAFATIYAAAWLAQKWGVLPLTRLGRALLDCFQRSLAAHVDARGESSLTAVQRVQRYVSANRAELVNLDGHEYPYLSAPQLDAHPGFLRTRKGRLCLLVRSSRWNSALGVDARSLLNELRRCSRLQVTDGLQLQIQVRMNKPKDRVHAVIID